MHDIPRGADLPGGGVFFLGNIPPGGGGEIFIGNIPPGGGEFPGKPRKFPSPPPGGGGHFPGGGEDFVVHRTQPAPPPMINSWIRPCNLMKALQNT